MSLSYHIRLVHEVFLKSNTLPLLRFTVFCFSFLVMAAGSVLCPTEVPYVYFESAGVRISVRTYIALKGEQIQIFLVMAEENILLQAELHGRGTKCFERCSSCYDYLESTSVFSNIPNSTTITIADDFLLRDTQTNNA